MRTRRRCAWGMGLRGWLYSLYTHYDIINQNTLLCVSNAILMGFVSTPVELGSLQYQLTTLQIQYRSIYDRDTRYRLYFIYSLQIKLVKVTSNLLVLI